jgi:PleD family two-component response regulator
VIASEHGDVKSTFSAGIAGYPALKNSTDITQSADEALYFSKRNGRNQVSLSHPEASLSTGTEK